MARPSSASLVVVGSLNVDFIAGVSLLPKPGDTVVAHQLSKRFGGKGAIKRSLQRAMALR